MKEDEKGCEACAMCGAPTDWARAEALDALMCAAFKRRAHVEQALQAMAGGHLPMPDAEELRRLARHLGVPDSDPPSANARIAELTADSERLDWLQFHGARVAWGNDDEVCNVVWCDRDGSYYTALFNNWRDAIDAAMNNRFKEGA